MPLIFADASTFTKKKSIPSLTGDIIAIDLPLYEGRYLRNLSPIECEIQMETYIPERYVVMSATKQPRFSNFLCSFNNKIPIEITPKTQDSLLRLVTSYSDEHSGILAMGGITNLKTGSPNWSPLQPPRTRKSIPFHTHPSSSYKIYNTNYGWPSKADVDNISLSFNAHLIPSLEGIYIISDKTCSTPPNKQDRHFSKCSQIDILQKCSWIVLPWNLSGSWFIY